jgi:hypothetical protein
LPPEWSRGPPHDLGGARTAFAFEGALLTLDSAPGVQAAQMFGARRGVPAHFGSRADLKEGRNEIEAAFTEVGLAGTSAPPGSHHPTPQPEE